MNLLTIDEYKRLPNGTKLISISGKRAIKGTDYVDLDTRCGFIAWSIDPAMISDPRFKNLLFDFLK